MTYLVPIILMVLAFAGDSTMTRLLAIMWVGVEFCRKVKTNFYWDPTHYISMTDELFLYYYVIDFYKSDKLSVYRCIFDPSQKKVKF